MAPKEKRNVPASSGIKSQGKGKTSNTDGPAKHTASDHTKKDSKKADKRGSKDKTSKTDGNVLMAGNQTASHDHNTDSRKANKMGEDKTSKTDGPVKHTASDQPKKDFRKKDKTDSPPGFPLVPIATVSLVVIAVALLVAVFTESADFGSFSFSESVIESINKAYSVIFNFSASFANFISETYPIIMNFLMSSTNSNFCNPKNNNTCGEFLNKKFRNLGLKYNEQSLDTWLTLYAAALDHVSYEPNPERPIVIMVYRLEDSPNATQVLEDIAGAYDSVLPPFNDNGDIIINGSSFIDSPPEETQKQIQDMLENGFENRGQKVAIVYDFDKLPSCSVLTFHNYCNNDDAPHKNVAIILTVTGMEEKLPSDPKSSDLEKVVNELFHEKWKDCPKELPPGKIDAMLSRIANNVILLR